jgi:tetratricopeptide (TPR) repeat protein
VTAGIPLSSRRREYWAIAVALFACGYLFLAGKEFAASIFAARPELSKLELAVRLAPGNADYRHRLGRCFAFVAGDPQSAIDSFRAATAMNPYNSRYWFDLAAAYQVTGNAAGQRTALERALEAEPTAPDVAWEAANFFLINGEIHRALREFNVVIANDITLVYPAFQASWRVRPDAQALLSVVVPARADSLLSFLDFLMSKQETDGALETWDRILALREKFPNHYLFEFVHYLVDVHRTDAALAAWEQSADILGLSAYQPSDDNLIVNGDFSLDVLNGGFDWTYVNRPGVKPELDPSDFHQGQRSLLLTFEGQGINDSGISQLIPVRPVTTYDFSVYYKSADFQGAGGPQIVLRDAYTHAPLFASDLLNDSDFWRAVHAKVTMPDTTTLLLLTIERSPSGSPIRGKLWLDDFELSPVSKTDSAGDSSGHSPGNSKDKP